MARSPNDPYYTRAIPNPEPKINEQWSWDEFLGGLAQGAVSGAGVGINLREARDKAAAARLKVMEANPDFYLGTLDRITKPITIPDIPSAGIPGRDMDLTQGAAIGDLGAYGIPERTTPEQIGVDLSAVKEARDRELARRRFAQSPEAESFMKDITQTQADVLRASKAAKDAQLIGDSVKKAATDFTDANAALVSLAAQRRQLEEQKRAAIDAGDNETAASLQGQVDLMVKHGFEHTQKMMAARAAMLEHGLTKEDWDQAIKPGNFNTAVQDMIFKVTRGRRTRKPGTK